VLDSATASGAGRQQRVAQLLDGGRDLREPPLHHEHADHAVLAEQPHADPHDVALHVGRGRAGAQRPQRDGRHAGPGGTRARVVDDVVGQDRPKHEDAAIRALAQLLGDAADLELVVEALLDGVLDRRPGREDSGAQVDRALLAQAVGERAQQDGRGDGERDEARQQQRQQQTRAQATGQPARAHVTAP
jgi:hypothetical protein